MADQAIGNVERIGAHLVEWVRPRQFTTHIVEIEAAYTARCIVQGFPQSFKV